MRILYVTDLHGDVAKYDRVSVLAQRHGVRAVINGGDLYPHERYLFNQKYFLNGYLPRHLANLESQGIACLLIPGNDDLQVFDEWLNNICGRLKDIHNIAMRSVVLGGWKFIGFNLVPDYRFTLKDRCRMDNEKFKFEEQPGYGYLSRDHGWERVEDWKKYARRLPTIREELDKLPMPDDPSRTVYVIHTPPSGLGLDVCDDWRMVGSRSVRDYLIRMAPAVSFHGHIHGSQFMTRYWAYILRDIRVIQPGQLEEEELVYVIADLQTMSFQMFIESIDPR
jgi:uncharacterized protein